MIHRLLLVCLALTCLAAAPPCDHVNLLGQPPESITRQPLSRVDQNREPWRDLDAEQSYVYIGNTPRELALGLPLKPKPTIPLRLKERAERELERLRKQLKLPSAEFEIWPTYDDWNSLTWMVARYRESPRHAWKWLDQSFVNPNQRDFAGSRTGIVLPDFLDPNQPDDADQIFNHAPADLYQRPVFENVLWMTPDRKKVLAAWLKYGEDEEKMKKLCGEQPCVAVTVNPPARHNEEPTTFVVRSDRKGTAFPKNIQWEPEIRQRPHPSTVETLIEKWPDVRTELTDYVSRFSGGTKIFSPVNGQEIDMKKQSSGQKNNQLWHTANYLVKVCEDELGYRPEKNEHLGYDPKNVATKEDPFTTRIERFDWEGIPQTNVIATIKGKKRGPVQRIVVGSAHFDKAISEDIYTKSGGKIRETTPGTDDNASGVAALLVAMKVLKERYKDNPPDYDIEIVFDTGEEFPAGTAGARKYVSREILGKKRDVEVNYNLDMIGHRTRGDRVWEIDPGNLPGSWQHAETMLAVANALNAQLPKRSRWDASVLYPWSVRRQFDQTSGGIFDWAGLNTVSMTQDINLKHRWDGEYHQSTDKKIDAAYAEFQTKVLIECLARAAEGR